MAEHKFPSEVIDLPSEGKLYPKEHPCSNGKIEIKYMTAKEEDILTSANLIKKGIALSVHDISSGGMLVSLAEMSMSSGLGLKIYKPTKLKNFYKNDPLY